MQLIRRVAQQELEIDDARMDYLTQQLLNLLPGGHPSARGSDASLTQHQLALPCRHGGQAPAGPPQATGEGHY